MQLKNTLHIRRYVLSYLMENMYLEKIESSCFFRVFPIIVDINKMHLQQIFFFGHAR